MHTHYELTYIEINNKKGAIGEDFKVVETWMLTLRFQEEITQTQKEMSTYIQSLVSRRKTLLSDMENYQGLHATIRKTILFLY